MRIAFIRSSRNKLTIGFTMVAFLLTNPVSDLVNLLICRMGDMVQFGCFGPEEELEKKDDGFGGRHCCKFLRDKFS